MGLISLPVLNRLGYVNMWNIMISGKFIYLFYYYYYLILKIFFSLFFIDFFFGFYFKLNKIFLINKKLSFLKCVFYLGEIYLLKFQNWIICYCNFFILRKFDIKKFFFKYINNFLLFFNYYKIINLNYKFRL